MKPILSVLFLLLVFGCKPPIQDQGLNRTSDVREPNLVSVPTNFSFPAVPNGSNLVLVDIAHNADGSIILVKAIVGPSALLKPAEDYLSACKFTPCTIDGRPVSLRHEIKVKFDQASKSVLILDRDTNKLLSPPKVK